MAEEPDGRRNIRTWAEWAVIAAPWASLIAVIYEIIDDWILHV
ncbi:MULTISPECIES: hypothetical protein [Streptomyces]|jgi:hypothetical protein|nr:MULTISPECIES: hypothetical protein [Streptomyces]MCR3732159.1 hypothetical protein [Streptomyces umbrinus]GHB23872.1 hypothetical protein GCM10010306_016240 [Streptomyces umbrinus]GHH38854.1 hypothetical protein GCM10018775_18290 [Streptomyces umbrinus]